MSDPLSDINEEGWSVTLQHPPLNPDQIHIWKAQLSPTDLQLTRLSHLLSSDELVRAERFKFPQHQKAFVTARGVLRILLSRYLSVPPQSLTFSQGPHGKPFLSTPTTPQLSFNLSHSHNLALYALTWNKAIGIDIEFHRPEVDDGALIQRICSEEEKAHLAQLAPDQRKQAFFACWTRKEAYVKAIGKGITTPLEDITVSLPPSDSVALLHIKGEKEEASRWFMHEILVDPNYTAAVTVEGGKHSIKYWTWSWEEWNHTENFNR